jgi:membrane-bound serine protease (ClpP class)
MLRRAVAAMALALGVIGLAAPAAADADQVARIELTGVIDQVNAAYIEEALRVAGESGDAAALIVIDSPGGELTSMDRIIKAILASEVPVITWVAPEGARAGSAATFITLAADVAAMAPNTNIGAASVVGGGGEDLPDTLARKVTNDAVARIRALANDHERNADWAESAVREAASVDANEAVSMDPPVVDLVAADAEALFAAIDEGERADGYQYQFNGEPLPQLSDTTLRDLDMNFGQEFLHLLSDPNIAFLLFTIGFYGIVAELFHPNFFSGILGAIAIVVALIGSNALPLNVGGLLLIIIAVGLFALEAHARRIRAVDRRPARRSRRRRQRQPVADRDRGGGRRHLRLGARPGGHARPWHAGHFEQAGRGARRRDRHGPDRHCADGDRLC